MLSVRVLLLTACWLAAGASSAAPAGFAVLPASVQSEDFTAVAAQLDQQRLLQALVERLNRELQLPQSVGLRLVECGEANAYYLAESREVRICFELLDLFAARLMDQVDDQAQLQRAVLGATRFIALHEAGHALVDVLGLAITGREEDVVDQFAAWLLIGDEDGRLAVLSAAAAFLALAADGDSNLANQHSLDEQRYFNMLCWVYGRDPKGQASLIEDWGLPAGRAAGCADEYAQLDRGWTRLLQPHRPGPKPATPSANPAPSALEEVNDIERQEAGTAPAAEQR